MQEASTEDNPPVHQIGQSLRSSTSFTHNGANSSLTNRRERLLKILVVGDYAVGKTSLIRRYCEDIFSESYRITIGVDYHEKHFPDRSARVQLWDVAGHERFGNMTRTYYKYAVGAFVVYDITRPSSMEGTLRWWNDIRSKVELPDGSCIPAMLVGNKIDAIPVEEYERVYNEATKFASANGFVGFEAVSAKTAHNIPSGLDKLVVHAEASTNGLPMLTSSYENRMSSLKPNQRIDLIELRNPSTGRIQQLREKCCTPS